jgi:uncharacterized protein YgfB (UPF0149 family)
MTTPPDYDTLADALSGAGVPLSVAEVHGMTTGLLCTPPPHVIAAPRLVLRQSERPEGAGAEQAAGVLSALQDDTEAKLHDPGFSFQPMLVPEYDEDVAAAVSALGEWCRGFLFGLVAGGVRDFERLPANAREFVQDVMQIAEVEATPDTSDEDEARSITELTEYLRAGVQLLCEELRQPQH